MNFVISGLDPTQLPTNTAHRRVVDERPGYPCRVTLEDAQVGEEVLLLHFEHLGAGSPYRASGPIFVRPAGERRVCAPGEVPVALQQRLLSVRGYDASQALIAADVVDGPELAERLRSLLEDHAIAFVHVHHARPGCFACRVDRA